MLRQYTKELNHAFVFFTYFSSASVKQITVIALGVIAITVVHNSVHTYTAVKPR